MKWFLSLIRALAATLIGLAATCTSPGPPAATRSGEGFTASAESRRSTAQAARERPGLGTSFGETRRSQVELASFERASRTRPLAVGRVFYNDEAGARAMADQSGYRRISPGPTEIGDGLISLGVRDGRTGRLLPGFVSRGRTFVIGESGRRYTLSVRNLTDSRIEIVLSVDGLDVIDGRPASVEKPGYIVGPRGRLEVDGFRRSLESVAAFRFGSVPDSYANRRYGDTRNVGVIGAAVFHERGDDPYRWTRREIRRRERADPFPGDSRFAQPPPGSESP